MPADGADRRRSFQPGAIRIRCPHCHQPVKLLDQAEAGAITCPECHSSFTLAGDATMSLNYGDTAAARKVPQQIAHFELLAPLGEGAFGTVWKARDTKLGRIVAIKVPRRGELRPEDVDSFLREAQTAAHLQHPDIVTVHEVGQEGDLAYIVSELIDGLPLDEWLDAQGRRLDRSRGGPSVRHHGRGPPLRPPARRGSPRTSSRAT